MVASSGLNWGIAEAHPKSIFSLISIDYMICFRKERFNTLQRWTCVLQVLHRAMNYPRSSRRFHQITLGGFSTLQH